MEEKILELERRIKQLEATKKKDQLSMVVFSGELDKLLAAMIIATGATAMDMEVKLFFTFWAISALRDKEKRAEKKELTSKMFGAMLPKGTSDVKLSKMNMGGAGLAMLKSLMKKKNVASLEDLLQTAGELGVEINICEMSMNLMGFSKDEMIDYPNLNYCGVGTYLADAEESAIQLFI